MEFEDLSQNTRLFIAFIWMIFLLWIGCDNPDSTFLILLFGWMGWAFIFKKEITQGYW